MFDAQDLITIPHVKLVRAMGKLSGAQLAAVERLVFLATIDAGLAELDAGQWLPHEVERRLAL